MPKIDTNSQVINANATQNPLVLQYQKEVIERAQKELSKIEQEIQQLESKGE